MGVSLLLNFLMKFIKCAIRDIIYMYISGLLSPIQPRGEFVIFINWLFFNNKQNINE